MNTKPLIVRDESGMCYLKIRDGWMEAYSLDAGGWTVSGVAPEGGIVALRQAAWQHGDHCSTAPTRRTPPRRAALRTDPHRPSFSRRRRAALIVTDGPMVFATIEGTSLEYVVNTSADVFREPTDQELYVRTSGRWFRSWTIDDPWQFVASSKLPADFAQIPAGSPKHCERERPWTG